MTWVGPTVNTGLSASKAVFLLPARAGVLGSQRWGMGETSAEGSSGFLRLVWLARSEAGLGGNRLGSVSPLGVQ